MSAWGEALGLAFQSSSTYCLAFASGPAGNLRQSALDRTGQRAVSSTMASSASWLARATRRTRPGRLGKLLLQPWKVAFSDHIEIEHYAKFRHRVRQQFVPAVLRNLLQEFSCVSIRARFWPWGVRKDAAERSTNASNSRMSLET
jgi:hypothetical protein